LREVQTLDLAFIEAAILLLEATASLDEHFRSEPEGVAGRRVIIRINKDIVDRKFPVRWVNGA
jgi:hypothetical protein